MLTGSKTALKRITQADRLWLFLDYDGTLADFAPTPDDILPDPEIIALLTRLKNHPKFKIGVVSGRRLGHLRALLPIQGLLLAGAYGVEILLPNGKVHNRLDYPTIRPWLENLKPEWQKLIDGGQGFYLEDKGWSLALHARFAEDQEAHRILAKAKELAAEQIDLELFRIMGGHKFLETSPHLANKGKTIQFLLDQYGSAEFLPVFIGDDDKDEEAFAMIQQSGGIPILVSRHTRQSAAELRLEAPPTVLEWLTSILDK
jgi:trehalose 6-phosphate phosphatase